MGYTLTQSAGSFAGPGTNSIPVSDFAAWLPSTKSYTAYDSSGDPVTIGSASTPSGIFHSFANAGDGSPWSDHNGDDFYPAGVQVTVPGNQPGGTYTGAFTFTALGN